MPGFQRNRDPTADGLGTPLPSSNLESNQTSLKEGKEIQVNMSQLLRTFEVKVGLPFYAVFIEVFLYISKFSLAKSLR